MDKEKIGKFIAKLRKDANLTQEELATKLMVERGTVSKWERGIYVPIPEDLVSIGNIFNISINELLAGERINKSNQTKINNVTAEVIKDSNRKIKRNFIFFLFTITILLLLFFCYYFFNNYNSISVYRINGKSTNFNLDDGILIISKEKSYIKLGNITSLSNKEITEIELFYKKNEKEYQITKGSDSNKLLVNLFGYDELYSYNDLKYLKSDLYLKIKSGEEEDIIKLDIKKDFSNINIFSNKIENVSDGEDLNSDSDIPKYIFENFSYNESEDNYYFEHKENQKLIKEKYLPSVKMYIVDESDDSGTTIHWEYSLLLESLQHYKIADNNMLDNFTYEFDTRTCTDGKCQLKEIEKFSEIYVKAINE